MPFALNRADRGKEKTSLCNLQNLCKKSNNNKKQLFFFSPPLTLIIIFPKGRGLGWSSEPALANAPACSSQAPVTKPSLRQALQSASFTTNFPSCFLIKFSASFKYQSMNHLHFLQIPLKTLNQAIKRGAAQRYPKKRHRRGIARSTHGLGLGKDTAHLVTPDFQHTHVSSGTQPARYNFRKKR